MAERVLEGQEEYMEAFRTPEGQKAYGTSVKNQILQMEKRWREAKKTLGVTGAGLDHETEIWKDERGDNLRNMWHEIKKFCPYYYALKPLLGERLVVTDHAITNSTDAIDTSSLLRSRSKVVALIGAESEEDENSETSLPQTRYVDSVSIAPVAGFSASVASLAGSSAPVAPLAGSSILVASFAGFSAPVASLAGFSAPVASLADFFALVALLAGLPAPVAPLAGPDNPLPGSGLRRKNREYTDFVENSHGITEAATSQKQQRFGEAGTLAL